MDQQNLVEISQFYGYLLNSEGNSIIGHKIEHPSQNVTTAKKTGIKKIIANAYDFQKKDNVISYLRRKILKTIKNIIQRLKLKQYLTQLNYLTLPFVSSLYNLIEQQIADSIWIVYIANENI